jgi:methylmalonyl-CoA carboxyltransferase 12S subunit
VALTFSDLVIVAALVAVGCAITYFSLQERQRRLNSDLQRNSQRQFEELAAALKNLESRLAALSQPRIVQPEEVRPEAAPVAKAEVLPPAVKQAAQPQAEKAEEVTPEMLVVIAAAVTAFLGKKVRIRSAKMLQSPYEIVNPWSQQGRVFVQASHNLRSRN